MFLSAIKKITNSIFPLFFKVKGNSSISLGVSGTGFFISDDGLFITADHVINNVPQNSKILFCGNVPHSVIRPVEITSIYADPEKDIFIGRVPDKHKLPKVELASKEAQIGQSLCLCGYPLARLSQTSNGSIDVSNVRKYWQPTFMIDRARGNIDGRNYKGFITQHTSLKGMSGGPVFGSDGLVYGMDVATMTRTIPDPSSPTKVSNGIVTGIEPINECIKCACDTQSAQAK